jgi:AcrR family transcriptional regulator
MARSKSSHRERLTEAMIVTAARYGYGESSVARVVAQAGVSRATFYQHFADKEACFLAAYRGVAERITEHMRRLDEEREAVGRPLEVLTRLLENADREPAAARLVLIEALAGGPAIRAEHEKLLDSVEESVEAYLDAAPGRVRLEIPARSVVGAIGSVVAIRIFRGETGRLTELVDDLGSWLASYATTTGTRRNRAAWEDMGSGIVSPVEPQANPLDVRLPRGRAALPEAVVASEHRQRVLTAVARMAREKGYASMTVADIVTTAHIGREAFYEQFRSKEDAFLAAQAYGLESSVSHAASGFFRDGSWPERVWSAALEMLGYIRSVPDLAHVDFVESYTAGPAAVRRSFESRMAYTLFLEEGYRQRPEAAGLPRLCSEAIAGAILELLRHRAVESGVEQLQELAPQAVYLALAPFIGPAEALRLVEAKAATERGGRPNGRSRAARSEG